MEFKRLLLPVAIILITLLFSANTLLGVEESQDAVQTDQILKSKENLAYTIGLQAYLYGYATVELYRTFYNQVIDPNRGHSISINSEFNHIRKLTTPKDTWVVTPNNDTLYSRAWLDLSKEPHTIYHFDNFIQKLSA